MTADKSDQLSGRLRTREATLESDRQYFKRGQVINVTRQPVSLFFPEHTTHTNTMSTRTRTHTQAHTYTHTSQLYSLCAMSCKPLRRRSPSPGLHCIRVCFFVFSPSSLRKRNHCTADGVTCLVAHTHTHTHTHTLSLSLSLSLSLARSVENVKGAQPCWGQTDIAKERWPSRKADVYCFSKDDLFCAQYWPGSKHNSAASEGTLALQSERASRGWSSHTHTHTDTQTHTHTTM